MPTKTSGGVDVIIRVREALKSQKNVDKLNAGLLRLTKTATRLPRLFFNIKTALAGAGIGYIAKQFVDATSTAEQYRIRLRVLIGDQEKANDVFENTSKFASTVSFKYEELMGSATNLAAVVKGGPEEIKQLLPIIADLAAASGLTIEETTSQIIRMYSAGAAAADMFRERGVLAMLGFKAKTQYTAEETMKRVVASWESADSKFRGAATELSKSWSGLLSMLSDAWFQFRNKVMEGDLFPWLKAALSSLLEQINELKESGALDKWAEEAGQKVVAMFEKMIMGAAKTYDMLMPILTSLKDAVGHILDIWKDLPTWVQSAGIIGALLFGKKGVAAIAGYSAVVEFFHDVSTAASQVMWDDDLKKEWFSLSPKDRRYFIKHFDEFGGSVAQFLKGPKFSGKINAAATEPIESLGQALKSATSATEKAQVILQYLRQLGQEYKKTKEVVRSDKGGGILGGPDPAIAAAADKLSLSRMRERTETALSKLQILYDRGLIALDKFNEQRRSLYEKSFNDELDALEKKAAAETDIQKKAAINDKIIQLKGDHVRKLLELDQWYYDEKKKLAESGDKIEKLMADVRLRTMGVDPSDLKAQFSAELAELQEKHRQEISELEKLTNDKMRLKELETLHAMEQNQLLADQERRIYEYRMKTASELASGLSEIFSGLYELSGQKQKEWFYLAKAAAMAEAIINTSTAVTKALAQGGLWGAAQATFLTAKGAIEVSKIAAQSLAAGGLVGGISSTPTADDKLINATAGEFMHPVKAVKHYGLPFMEAIRNLVFPRELTKGYGYMPQTPAYGMAFAGGGPIPQQAPSRERPVEFVNVNFFDPRELERFLATARGQGAVVNAVIARRNDLRRAGI